jgi:hypothetical protein
MTMRRVILALAGSVALAGCMADSGPSPILSVQKSNCHSAPDLAGAKPVALSTGREDDELEFVITRSSPCLETTQGLRSLYETVKLPAFSGDIAVRVEATPSTTGIFSPQITVLDADGKPLRQVPDEKMLFRSARLTASTRLTQGDAYLLVASNPERVGDVHETRTATFNSYHSGGPAYFSIYTATEETKRRTYSYGGQVVVIAREVDTTLDAR